MWSSIQEQILLFLDGKDFGEMNFFESVLKLIHDYLPTYLSGAGRTLLIALVGTIIGCIIGLAIGILQTIPRTKKDPLLKRGLLSFVRGILTVYVEFFRGTPMMIRQCLSILV